MSHGDRSMSDEELGESVEILNALLPDGYGWRLTQARKNHEDEHGVKIGRNESYYKRRYNGAYSAVLKYSFLSMDRHVFAIFAGNHGLTKALRKQIEEHRARVIQAVQQNMKDWF